MSNKYSEIKIFLCWLIACVATLGSLFFSEVMQYTPCALCWYQRVAMYPLVLLFVVGLYQGTKSTICFTAPIAFIGWAVALYHNLLHFKIIPESAAPCKLGVSCSVKYIEWFGFITIPMLSLLAFTSILLILFFLNRGLKNEK